VSDDLISHQLDSLSEDVKEIKSDVKEIKDGAPLYRISQLEKWRAGITTWLGLA
jgi:hypothetical protein